MIQNELENNTNPSDLLGENVCDLKYLSDMMGGKKSLIKEIMDAFLKQIPEELTAINEAVLNVDFQNIRKIAHTMKSTVSIMGIASLNPILVEMERLGAAATDFEKIKQLNVELGIICNKAVDEIKKHDDI